MAIIVERSILPQTLHRQALGRHLEINNFFMGTFSQALELARHFLGQDSPRLHVSLNANALYWAAHNELFRRSVEGANWVSADGASILLAGRLFGFEVKERVAGFDLMKALLEICRNERWAVGFLGCRADILGLVDSHCRRHYPGLEVVVRQWQAQEDFSLKLGRELRDRGVRVLFAALPSPQQEIWLSQNKNIIGVPLCRGVGGSFEVLIGQARRAPR